MDGPAGPKCTGIYSQGSSVAEVACHSNNGLVCVTTGSTPTCQALTGDCRQRTDAGCPNGGVCDQASGNCLSPVPIGGQCGPTAKCVAGAYCDGAVCRPVKVLHALCAESVECGSQRCSAGLCVPFSTIASLLCMER
jgi:hypothetical protein